MAPGMPFAYSAELNYDREVCRINIRNFHRKLRLLDANHLENFLCVFHTPLEAYADFLEREKLKRQKNRNQKS